MRQPLLINRLKILHLRQGNLFDRDFSESLRTFLWASYTEGQFFDWLNRVIFPAERKVLPWNSHPVAVVPQKPRNTQVNVVDPGITKVKESEEIIENADKNFVVHVARHIILKPNTQHLVFVTTKSDGVMTIKLMKSLSSHQCTLAARGIMDGEWSTCASFLYPCQKLLQPRGLPPQKKTIIKLTANLVVQVINIVDQITASIEISKTDVSYNASEVNALIEVAQHHPGPNYVSVVDYKHFKSRETQVLFRVDVEMDNSHQQGHNWWDQVLLSDNQVGIVRRLLSTPRIMLTWLEFSQNS